MASPASAGRTTPTTPSSPPMRRWGDTTAATAHAKEAERLATAFSAGSYLQTLHYKRESDREHHRKGLLEAGLPP
jgi:hypothetical protein